VWTKTVVYGGPGVGGARLAEVQALDLRGNLDESRDQNW
jgi:hypothetical protein